MTELARTTAYPMGLVWNDSVGNASSFPTDGTAPALVNVTTNIKQEAYATNDLFYGKSQISHQCAPGSDLRMHVHFTFPTQPTAGKVLRFEVYWTYAAINEAFSAESTVATYDYTVQASDAMIHRVLSLPVLTASATVPQSAWAMFRVKRVDPGGGTNVNIDPVIGFVDFHEQDGRFGTQTEFA